MRQLPILLIAVLLGVGPGACGGSGGGAGSGLRTVAKAAAAATPAGVAVSNSAARRGPPAKSDNDGDGDNGGDDIRWGRAASAVDRQAVIALVKRYYALAAAGDGAAGCSLIYSLLAEEIPETYGEPPGPPSLRGGTCAVVMSKVFEQKHLLLLADAATVKVFGVRVRGLRGLALLRFGGGPERDIPVHREHRVWRIDALLDSGIG